MTDEDRERLTRIEAKVHQTQLLVMLSFGALFVVIVGEASANADWPTRLIGHVADVALGVAVVLLLARLAGVRWRP